MSKRLFMDIHVLQTIPPSCVNRDDTGSPKLLFMVVLLEHVYHHKHGRKLFVICSEVTL